MESVSSSSGGGGGAGGGDGRSQSFFKRFPKAMSNQRLGGGSVDSISRNGGTEPDVAPNEGDFPSVRRVSSLGSIGDTRRSMSGAEFSHDGGGSRNGRADKYLDLSLSGMELLDVSTRGGTRGAPIKM